MEELLLNDTKSITNRTQGTFRGLGLVRGVRSESPAAMLNDGLKVGLLGTPLAMSSCPSPSHDIVLPHHQRVRAM